MSIREIYINEVLTRMIDTNDYIIGVEGRYYWANDTKSGVLMETATANHIAAVQTLAENKDTRIIHEFKHNML